MMIFFFQAEDGIRDLTVTGVQTCALPIFWRQFRRRLDPGRPYCLVLGHTEDEVREICAGYEEVYRDQFPQLHLVRWARSMYGWLTHPVLDPERSGRVTMAHLASLVRLGLSHAAAVGLEDVTGELL